MSDFERQMADAERQILEAIEGAKVDLVGAAFDQIVNRSPVRTGAYRAEHVITDESGAYLYESDNRPGPDAVVPVTGSVLAAPNVREARDSVRGTGLESVTIENNRFYAGRLEDGSSQQAPQGIYQVTADAVDAFPPNLDGVRIA